MLWVMPLAVPAMVSAQQEFYADPYYYETNADGSATLTAYTGPGGSVVIPRSISNLPVTGLYNTFGAEPFNPNTTLNDVTIPCGVVTIAYCAFNYCTSLSNVAIPPSVTSIGAFAFNDTALATITLPTNVTSIGDDAFSGCTSLTNAALYGITTLAEDAFAYCTSLETVTLPATIGEIIGNPFDDCPRLTRVFFQGNFPDDVSYIPDSGWPFGNNPGLTVYCLPGTSNWIFLTEHTGIIPVLWNPLIQTGNGHFGVQNNQFGFDITGTPAIPIVVEASTNLANPVWTALTNVTLTNGLFHFSEPAQANSAGRFYRISSP